MPEKTNNTCILKCRFKTLLCVIFVITSVSCLLHILARSVKVAERAMYFRLCIYYLHIICICKTIMFAFVNSPEIIQIKRSLYGCCFSCDAIPSPLRNTHDAQWGPLCENMTSSTKPEVHNLSQRQRRQRRTAATFKTLKNWLKFGRMVSEICEQTDRQMNKQTERIHAGSPLSCRRPKSKGTN